MQKLIVSAIHAICIRQITSYNQVSNSISFIHMLIYTKLIYTFANHKTIKLDIDNIIYIRIEGFRFLIK